MTFHYARSWCFYDFLELWKASSRDFEFGESGQNRHLSLFISAAAASLESTRIPKCGSPLFTFTLHLNFILTSRLPDDDILYYTTKVEVLTLTKKPSPVDSEKVN